MTIISIEKEFEKYRVSARRTRPILGSDRDDIIHMLLGLYTELGELADVFKKELAYKKTATPTELIEEAGDFFWYLAGLYDLMDFGIIQSSTMLNSDNAWMVIVAFTNLSIAAQHIELYMDGRVEEISTANTRLNLVVECVVSILSSGNISVSEVLDANVRKLRVRYPYKFDENMAMKRDLEKELQAIEGRKEKW